MVAAWRSAAGGAPVVLLERNRTLGIKLRISGGGRCNITHAGPMEEIRSAFAPNEARFLKPAFYRFGNDDILALLAEEGVASAARPDGRVFPREGTARDVVAALEHLCRRSGVQIFTGSHVDRIIDNHGSLSATLRGSDSVQASAIVLATGGASYPKTGTTGDGFRWAAELGHTIVPLRPALAPITVDPKPPRSWQGIALRGGCLSALADGTVLASCEGDLLFTHEGISGPAALELSRSAALAAERMAVSLAYDFFPRRTFDQLDDELNTTVRRHGSRTVGNVIEAWLPNRLVPALLQWAGISPECRGYALTRESRRSLNRLLKSWPVGRIVRIPLERGEVTAGGVALRDVDPHTMRSRRIPTLYLCGEVLDIAGPVGGYNLQAAFSTGFVAGESAAEHFRREFSSRDGRYEKYM